MEGGVECPLCSESFSQANIQSHASSCGIKPNIAPKRSIAEVLGKHPKPTNSSSAKKVKVESQSKPALALAPHEVSKPDLEKGFAKTSAFFDKPTDKTKPGSVPLAEQLRPKDFSSYIGQEGAVGEQTQIRRLLETDSIPSLILWGPPGCGKTSLANVIANKVKGKSKFVKMSACTCGVAEVRDVVKQAKNELAMFKRNTILFMDEVHRFSKAQQDSFLPHIESGVITFIGATTENPSFSLNAALLSRCRIVVLEKLSPDSLGLILERALKDNGIEISEQEKVGCMTREAVRYLSNIVDGDARAALNTLQILVESREGGSVVNLEHVKEAARRSHVLYDRTGDQHYFMASALQKSIRGSDDNAALYWLGRMLKGGEDPSFIARRLVRCAAEDVGLGDPTALPLAVAAFQGSQLIGKPECDVLLAQATVHLARAKKSHEVYHALKAVYQSIEQGPLPEVPLHLRNASSRLGTEQGWGAGYSYDLEKVGDVVYLPDQLKGTNFFKK